MRAKIRKYLEAPGSTDEDRVVFAASLRTLFITLLIISPVVLAVGLLVNNPKYVWGVIISDGVVLGALWLLQRGFIRSVGFLLPLVLFLLAMYFVFVGHGLNDTALLMFPLVIVLAGLLLGRAGVVSFTLAAIFYIFFIFYAEKYELIITCCDHLIGLDDPVAITVILATTALIFELLSGRLSAALAESRRNEQTLRESEAKLRLIYENAYDGIGIYEELPNRSRRLIDCNERYAEIAGRSKEELLRVGNTSLIQKKISPDMNMEEILRVRRENTPYHGLFSWIRPDGKENIIEYSAAPIEVGGRPWTVGLDRDITEHKQITEKLRGNEALLKTIINQIPFDLWVCDGDGRYMMQNAISYGLAGDLIGKTVDDLALPAETRAVYKQNHLQALSGQTVRKEIEVTVKGQPRIWESVQAPIRDGERILGLIGMRIDITERVQAEAALQEYSERLEEMVAERTAELEQTIRQLQETQERLTRQEKLAVLGQLAGSVGHELRNPLGVINNALYFLNMVLSGADETVKEYLDLIASRVDEANKIVTDLLNLSRTQATARQEVAIPSLVSEALQRHPPPEAIRVVTPEGPALPPVWVDPQQIGQVLGNLITNAYQAMPKGGALSISAQNEAAWVKLSVADTGVGMAPETMEKIFEPLFTRKARGIGLGLAVSKNLVEVNGGRIEVASNEGQGTTFTLSLPTVKGIS